MRLNLDCIRAVLFYLESNQKLDEPVYLNEIVKGLNSFDKNDVIYSVKQLNDSHYLSCRVFKMNTYNCAVFDITPKGHEFIENIRNEDNWNQTKHYAKKVGSFSLDVLSKIAVSVITKLINSQFP